MPSKPSKVRQDFSPIVLFFGVFFLLLAAQEGCYQNAVKLRGVVIAKEYSSGTSRLGPGSVSSSSKHKIRYSFTAPDGKVREDRSNVLLNHWNELHEGDAVDIEYLPATGDSRIPGQTASAPVFLLVGALLLAGGFALRRRLR